MLAVHLCFGDLRASELEDLFCAVLGVALFDQRVDPRGAFVVVELVCADQRREVDVVFLVFPEFAL